ncbi:MAG: hypothetical protein SGPRY_003389 [Prymnesium sp.]
MGALFSCFGSCVGSCAASVLCATCSKMCGCGCFSDSKCAHYLYVLLITIAGGTALALRYEEVDLNVGFEVGINGISTCRRTNSTSCGDFSYSICSSDECKGYWAVYRISFTLAVFFLVMMLFTTCKSKASTQLHVGFWLAKILVLVGLFASTLFLPNDVFAVYAWIARVIAPIFTFFMLTMFIDFGYSTNSLFLEKDEAEDLFFGCENNGNAYKITLVLLSLSLFGGAFTGSAFMYSRFPGGGDCGFNTLAITTNLVFGIITSLIGLTKIAPHASIFVSALVTAYTTWIALYSFPLVECNPSLNHSGVNTSDVQVVVADGPNSSSDADNVEPRAFAFYHLLMLATSLYLAMLLTDWGVPRGEDDAFSEDSRHNVGYASAWLELAFTWACSALYLWTLIAPRCCPNRDFGVEVEPLCGD